MTVIRRWECPEHGVTIMFSTPMDPAKPDERACTECDREPVQVEYVPASQLEGAVETLADLRELVAGFDDTPEGVEVQVSLGTLKAILDRRGGQ